MPFFFQGIPGHLFLPILENLDPLEIEKLEDSCIFKAMSMLEKSILLIELYTFKALCGMVRFEYNKFSCHRPTS